MTDAPDGPSPRLSKRGRSRAEFEASVADFEAQVRATNARIEKRTGRNLPLAIGVGLVLGFGLLFSLIFLKFIFVIFAGALLVFTAFELASALRFAGRDVPRIPTVIAGLVVAPASFFWHANGQWLSLLAGIGLVTLWRLAESLVKRHRSTGADLVKDLVAGIFVQSYVVFLGSFALLLAGQDAGGGKMGGQWWTLGFLIVVISTDTGAYASGLLFGKHPMAPRISPKKTWEGFAGSMTVAAIAGILVSTLMLGEPIWFGIIFGIVIALAATMGDLTESLIKRDLGIKDISTWLPGHGGFLDRLDSVLPSAAVAYALYLIFG
ncbi:phosphatidate cytidylyltransferase [Glaciihabitans sp. dw_435]|uniref:phosphatidate cytidylyltransferase n=1 Tax=Glaciihabitans sp. dw_435 TaxID=2720081 RepID=UPI001BD50396|nr:phosphatidate cytidylyltransferase [Glaciihabitans sp. dw_435]